MSYTYIFTTEEQIENAQDALLEQWADANYPDKVFISCEDDNVLANESLTTLMVMEFQD